MIAPGALLVPLASGRWGLLTRGGATLNGLPALPVHVLADRDEVRVHGTTHCFTFEGLPAVVPYPAHARATRCGRCQADLRPGELALACSRCGAWHHQSDDRPCWTYAAGCATCRQPTDGSAWEPAPLARPSVDREAAGR